MHMERERVCYRVLLTTELGADITDFRIRVNAGDHATSRILCSHMHIHG